MTLRSRLALALVAAAVLPMSVVVGLPFLRAETRAQDEAAAQLEQARRQASFLLEAARREFAARVARAADDLARDPAALAAAVEGPEEVAHAAATALAARHGFAELDIVDMRGLALAAAGEPGPPADPARLAGVSEGWVVLRTLARAPADGMPRPGFFTRVAVPAPGIAEPLALVAGRALGPELVSDVAGMTGRPAALLDPAGNVVLEAGGPVSAALLQGDVALENGWVLRVAAERADVRQERRELLAAFTQVAPLALVAALLVGLVLAERVSRPIRELAERADQISEREAGFTLLERERDEVHRLRRSFDRMLDALAHSEAQREAALRIGTWKDVARRIAHEVKNPLSPIRLAVENLRRTRVRAPEAFDRALEQETAVILEEVESLTRLVDEFSRFARLPAPQPAPCDPREIVKGALALFAPRLEELGVALEFECGDAPRAIVADAEQLGRVLKNILQNALLALEPVAQRRLAVAVREDGAGQALFAVTDSGTGMEPETARRLFEPYFTTRAERGGTGLGMAIAYRIVAEHGGTIDVRSAPGAGTTIAFRVPVGRA